MNFANLALWIFQHLAVVLTATAIAVVVGVALGVLAYWYRPVKGLILAAGDIIQTIPSLALLALLMIWFGLGNTTLIIGLVLYSLLPIIRNTHTGLAVISPQYVEAARGMGMSRMQRLFKVELPLALPMVFAGVKIAIVTSLGIAVMGVLIGAQGLGYPIYRGIQTESVDRILTGALPVVVMALAIDYGMTWLQKRLVRRSSTTNKGDN